MKTLEELKQEMDTAWAAWDDADAAWEAADAAFDAADADWGAADAAWEAADAVWAAAARDAYDARDAYAVARVAYHKKLKELTDEDT